jgi:hypothetical protein
MSYRTQTQTEQVARRFAALLRETLTPVEVGEVVIRNRQNDYVDCCASHDFCDANEVMARAIADVTGREVDVQDEGQRLLWNEAWDMARGNEFWSVS